MTICLFASDLYSDIAVTVDARKNLILTVYRDFGIVKDIRKVNLPEGVNRIRFEGVASRIIVESVNIEWKGVSGIELLGQSYEFDLMSPLKLMEKYVGREVEIVPDKDLWPDSGIQSAELISIHGKEPVFRIGTKITFGNIGRILFPYIPDNLYTKPTLLWDVNIPKRQETEIVAGYITEGFSWKAAYTLQLDRKEETAFFGGWITVANESGLDCRNVQMTFVDGNILRIKDEKISNINLQQALYSSRCLGEYDFYSISQRVTVLSNRSSHIEWIPKTQVRVKQLYIAELNAGEESRGYLSKVYGAIEIENAESNGLGIPLPQGTVRIYKRDANDENRFIGESLLDNTKIGKPFSIKINIDEGISILQKKNQSGDFVIEASNNKDRAVIIKLCMNTGGSNIADMSRKPVHIDDSSLEWSFVVKSHEVEKISYTLRKN